MNELLSYSATHMLQLLNTGEITSEALTHAHLKKIEHCQPILNAYQQIHADEALETARTADKAFSQGKRLGRLHGLPISIKDSYYAKGYYCSLASQLLLGEKATWDATVVARVRAEGAVILGMTNVPEMLATYETDNVIYGRTNNPYNLNYTPGGSSGGEAAAIASGCSPLGIGSDAGGSIRVPAYCTGIAGLKPTQGRVPLTGMLPTDSDFGLYAQISVLGPMARYVDDLSLMLDILSGPDGYDPFAMPVPASLDPDTIKLHSIKLAYWLDNGIVSPTDEVTALIQSVVKALSNDVQSTDEVLFPDLSRVYEVGWEGIFLTGDGGEALSNAYSGLEKENISPYILDMLASAKTCQFTANTVRERLDDMVRMQVNAFQAMHDYDVLICPVASHSPRKHGEAHKHIKEFTYSLTFNLLGWPSVVVRCGTSKEGLPMGVQIVGKPWSESVILAVAKHLEAIFGGWVPPEI